MEWRRWGLVWAGAVAFAVSLVAFLAGCAGKTSVVTTPPPGPVPTDSVVTPDSAALALAARRQPPKGPAVSIVAAKAVAGQLQIVASFRAGAQTSSLVDSAGYAGVPKVGHTLPAAATVDTFLLPLPTVATTGTFSVWGVNDVGVSAPATANWTYTPPIVVTIPPTPTGVKLVARAAGTQLWLILSWNAAAGATSYPHQISLNVSPWTKYRDAAGAALVDSVAVPMPATTTPYFACVSAANSAGTSSGACNSLSFTPPLPPGTPTIDSIQVRSVGYTGTSATGQTMKYAAAGDMVVGTNTAQRLFCAFCFLHDGSVRRADIPTTTKDYANRVSACDSLGRVLWNVRYSAKTVRLLEYKLAGR